MNKEDPPLKGRDCLASNLEGVLNPLQNKDLKNPGLKAGVSPISMKPGSLISGVLLIAGTTIGGGMLAMPVLTGLGGFYPSLVTYILCWAFMASTGLLFVELCSSMGSGANIISMARKTLGLPGQWAAWVLYIFLFYSLVLAYFVGCGDIISQQFEWLDEWTGGLVFVAFVAPLIFVGPRLVSPINLCLMVGLGISFVGFIVLGAPYVNLELTHRWNVPMAFVGLPIAFTAFAYQGTIPTLYQYMGEDAKRTRSAVLIGSAIPMTAYIIWQLLILGIVPVDGAHGLKEVLSQGGNAVMPLKYWIDSPLVVIAGELFAFCALVTSFFGVALGLVDFLADGLKIKKSAAGKCLLCVALFLPPIIVSYFIPHLFLTALDYAGGIGCALLLGLLPVLMIWSLRYDLKAPVKPQLKGGKIVLLVLILFVLVELFCESLRGNEFFTI